MALAAVSAVSAVGPGLHCQIQKFQAFIAVPVFSQSQFLKNMAVGWSHVSRLGSLGGGGSNGSIACSENMFGGCWITG